LAELFNLPVTNTLMGLGSLPGTHKQFVGMLGMHGTYEANKTMHNSDLILAVGARFDDRVTNNVAKFCPHATIVHVDVDPTSISKTVQAHVPIVGSVIPCWRRCWTPSASCGSSPTSQAWRLVEPDRAMAGPQVPGYETQPKYIKPQQVIETLYKVTKGEAMSASDVGQHQMFAALYYPFAKPRQWINSGGLGTMGFGLPAAMGARLPTRMPWSVCVTGDGSVQMNIQELSTCLQYGVPVKIISMNNRPSAW
jgi:acetolactate synthase I/II/III large subunit